MRRRRRRRTTPPRALAALAAVLITLTGCGSTPARAVPPPQPSASSSRTTPPSPSANPKPVLPVGPTAPGGVPKGPAGSLVETGTSAIALTFDDGPDPVTTPKLLALLRRYHVHATFCVIGSRARDYPDLIRAIVADGHTLCNHSWQHLQNLHSRPWSYQNWDLRSTTEAIQKDVPGVPVNFFRAPGGAFTPALVKLVREQHMKPLYWDVDPRDWDNPTYGWGPSMVHQIVTTVEREVHPGSVILSHDRGGHPDTVTAYETLLPCLLARYQIVPLL
jgi:peptidoglycan/xylan/chitin deacetylase (PgdA/CDA1 family)